MLILLSLMGITVLLLIGIGVAIGGFLIMLTLTGLALGMLSASLLIGYLNKSVKTGVQTFILLLTGLLGAPSGILMLFIIRALEQEQAPNLYEVAVPGGIAGLIGGVVMGAIFLRVLAYLKYKLEVKYNLR